MTELQALVRAARDGAKDAFGRVVMRLQDTETMRGCQAILAGQYDPMPEEAFYFVGTIERAVAKAKPM
jgi:F0F1-type ATP synthase beta subunit